MIQHCTGNAKSLIEYCLLLNPAEGFAKAKQVLHENFGKKNTIATAYIKTLLDGPDIKYDDSNALISLSRKLEEYYTSLEHLYYFEGRESNFADLERFVLNEAKIAKSSYSTAVGQTGKKAVGQKVTKFSRHLTLVSGAKNQQSLNNECAFCLSNHSLWDCSEFRRNLVHERLQFMRQKRLCDDCGKRGHVAKYCFSRPACGWSVATGNTIVYFIVLDEKNPQHHVVPIPVQNPLQTLLHKPLNQLRLQLRISRELPR